jgi:4'-phosphopantetheinyl transferase
MTPSFETPIGEWLPSRPRPTIDEHCVLVWRVPLHEPWASVSVLAPDEQARAARLRDPSDRDHWVASRVALRVLLGALLACRPEEVALHSGRDVRPHLGGAAPWLSFNVAHSGALAMIAFASRVQVGVDLEQGGPTQRSPIQHGAMTPSEMRRVAERVLPARELARLAREPTASLPAAFYREWVRHEALTKCRGDGLVDHGGGPRSRQDPEVVLDVVVGPDHAAAVAVSERPRRVELVERV